MYVHGTHRLPFMLSPTDGWRNGYKLFSSASFFLFWKGEGGGDVGQCMLAAAHTYLQAATAVTLQVRQNTIQSKKYIIGGCVWWYLAGAGKE